MHLGRCGLGHGVLFRLADVGIEGSGVSSTGHHSIHHPVIIKIWELRECHLVVEELHIVEVVWY